MLKYKRNKTEYGEVWSKFFSCCCDGGVSQVCYDERLSIPSLLLLCVVIVEYKKSNILVL
jgi:hypothetical protein